MTQRRLAAILTADMAGYSRLMAADEAGTLTRLKALRRAIIDPEIEQHGGEIVKLTGDGMLVLFGSVVAAVEAAAAVQTAITSAEQHETTERRIDFRIGINLGDVILDDGDIYGDGVNIAARLEAEAEPGGVTLSDDAFRQVRGKTGLSFVDLGELMLKNIATPVRAHRVELVPVQPANVGLRTPSAEPPECPDRPSIAVLPFQNMSADADQEYFCDGVSEDIITELSRFSELFVIARNSSFSFKGRAVTHRDVERELGARYMLEGSLRRAGNRVRITAQLIDCTTGAQIWAERYDRDLDDIFELQDGITRDVVGAIAPQIERAEIARVQGARRMDVTSYDLGLQALAQFHKGTVADDASYEAIIANAQRAQELDPRNTHALWIEAYTHAMRYLFQADAEPDKVLERAAVAAEKLFRGDRSDARAFSVRGMIKHFRREFDAATADFQRSFVLNQNYALNLFLMAWHESLVVRIEDAKTHAHLALRLSPRDLDLWIGDAYLALQQASFAENDLDQACHWGDLANQMTPHAPIRRALMIASLAHLDRLGAAAPHVEALSRFAPALVDGIAGGRLVLYRSPETNARLIDGLRKTGLVGRAE